VLDVSRTSDGGKSWTSMGIDGQASTYFGYFPLSCASTSVCELVGAQNFERTTDGGMSWKSQNPPSETGYYNYLAGITSISCASASVCQAVVGYENSALGTTNGGATWTVESLPAGGTFDAISCPTTSVCSAADGSTVARTADGGETWQVERLPADVVLKWISCPSARVCWAVGSDSKGAVIVSTLP
jgi:photosystem II stability/assembly factor-like uncharacterized protein